MVGTTGLDSLKKIVENVSSWLEADCVMIGEIQPDKQTVKVLSMLLDGKDVPDFSYKLKDTPCENASEKGFCLYQDNVRQFFPKAKDLVDLNIRGYAGTALRNSEGDVMGILCVLTRSPIKPVPAMQEIMDVIATKASAEIERTRIEHTLRESEEKFRALVETTSEFIWEVDDTGTYTYVSPKVRDLLGYEPAEVIGKTPFDFMPPDEAERVAVEFGKYTEVRHPFLSLENRNIRKDGSTVILDTSGVPKFDKNGDFAGYRGIDRDITERKKAEEALRQSEEQFRAIFHNQQTGLLMIDAATHVITDANKTALSMIGSGKEEVIGKVCHTYICPAECGRCPVTDLGQTVDNSERILLNAKRERVPILKSVNKIEIDGKPYLIESFIDITERKTLQEAVQMANRKLNLLSSITRHDIINQLTLLTGYIRISQGYLDDKNTLVKFLEKADKAATTIDHHIRFTGEYQELGVDAPAWQNVHESIEKAVAGLPMRGIHVDIDRRDLEIFADRLCGKVFYNLIDNALRYGRESMKTIRFSSQESGTGLSIVCEDDGVGIEDDVKLRLFTRGFGKNTGLGLFLSREILSITGITITENGTEGKGARFEITVPKGQYRFTGNGQK
jgi:PAS domain S-box-containing protein